MYKVLLVLLIAKRNLVILYTRYANLVAPLEKMSKIFLAPKFKLYYVPIARTANINERHTSASFGIKMPPF